MSQYVTLELKRGLASEWATKNPTLASGEPGFELDTGQLKIGNGSTAWNSLSYISAQTNPVSGAITLGQNVVATGGPNRHTISIGHYAGLTGQGNEAIAIGSNAGDQNQGSQSIAIGSSAGYFRQGARSIAIGTAAGFDTYIDTNFPFGLKYREQADNTIILNASGVSLAGVSGQTSSFYVSPIRQDLTKTTPLMYDPLTHEIVQGATKWVEDIPSKYDIFITTGGSVQVGVDISSLPKSTRYFLTLSPINTVMYTTSKSKSLSVIINYTGGGDIIGGASLFLDINNYITLSSHPSNLGMIGVSFISNSTAAESFSVSVRKIF